jgi:hypothetical protein
VICPVRYSLLSYFHTRVSFKLFENILQKLYNQLKFHNKGYPKLHCQNDYKRKLHSLATLLESFYLNLQCLFQWSDYALLLLYSRFQVYCMIRSLRENKDMLFVQVELYLLLDSWKLYSLLHRWILISS